MLTDPIADYLTRVRNALRADHTEVEMPASRLKKEISRILVEQGYVQSFEAGMFTVSCAAWMPLRMRVRKSAMGSVMGGLPARLRHPRNEALVRELAQADPAEAELAVHRTGPAALAAAGVLTGLVLRAACLAHAL
jgi:hypothetical protein